MPSPGCGALQALRLWAEAQGFTKTYTNTHQNWNTASQTSRNSSAELQDGWKPSGHLSGVEWVLPLAAPPVATLSPESLSDPPGWERTPGQWTDANKCEEQSCGKVNNGQVNTHILYLHLKSHSCVWLFATPWTIYSMELSRSEYWSG